MASPIHGENGIRGNMEPQVTICPTKAAWGYHDPQHSELSTIFEIQTEFKQPNDYSKEKR